MRYELGPAALSPERGTELDEVAVFPGSRPETRDEVWVWGARGPRVIREFLDGPVVRVQAASGFGRIQDVVAFVDPGGQLRTTDGLNLASLRLPVDLTEIPWTGVISAGEQAILIDWEGGLWGIDAQLQSTHLFSHFEYLQVLNGVLWVATPGFTSVQGLFRVDPDTLEPRMITDVALVGMAAVQNEMWLFVHRGRGVISIEKYSSEGESLGALGEITYPHNKSSWAEGGWSLADGSLVVRARIEANQPPRLVQLIAGEVTDTWPVDDWASNAIIPWQGGLLYGLDGQVMWLAGDGSRPQVLWESSARVVRFADLGAEVLVEIAGAASLLRIDEAMTVQPFSADDRGPVLAGEHR